MIALRGNLAQNLRTTFTGLSAAVVWLAISVFASTTALAGESLFRAPTAGELLDSRNSVSVDPMRQRLVTVDPAVVAEQLAPSGHDNAPDRVGRAMALGGTVRVDLMPGISVRLRRKDIDIIDSGGYFWSGAVIGNGYGEGSFLIRDGGLFGTVVDQGRMFRIERISGAVHLVSEIPPETMKGDIVVPAPSAADAPTQRSTIDAPSARTRITYLVAYTTKAKNASSDIIAEIEYAIAWANQAFKDSGAKIRYKLVGTKWVKNYDEDGKSYSGVLYDLRGGGDFTSTRNKRDRVNADLVSLIREGGSYCGIAFYVASPSAASSDSGYSVTTRTCIPTTFAHEAGHNIGLQHDRHVVSSPAPGTYNYGFVNLPNLFRTIMAYNTKCSDKGKYCPRIQRFSNPKRDYNGNRTGKRASSKNAAHSVKKLNENRHGVAAYR